MENEQSRSSPSKRSDLAPLPSSSSPSEAASIVVCNCAFARAIDPAVNASVLNELKNSGTPFTEVSDLCALSARHDPSLHAVASRPGVKIAACHPRAVKWLFAAAGARLDLQRTEVVNLRELAVDAAVARLLAADFKPNLPPDKTTSSPASRRAHAVSPLNSPEAALTKRSSAEPGPWFPWFPVIDYDRCTDCMQCLSFCLFGVYGVDEDGSIQVQSHESCKANCPACSRVCPEAAIVFPKYKTAPINGGEPLAGDAAREPMKVDLSALVEGDVLSALRQRGGRSAQPRFSVLRDSDQALQERKRCLAKFAQSGDIPPEVFKQLPPPDELLRRAAVAKAKANAALEAKK